MINEKNIIDKLINKIKEYLFLGLKKRSLQTGELSITQIRSYKFQ